MLSSQTKDQVTAVAFQNLSQKLPGGLNLDSVLQAEEKFLDECIYVVGFHRKKAKYVRQHAFLSLFIKCSLVKAEQYTLSDI